LKMVNGRECETKGGEVDSYLTGITQGKDNGTEADKHSTIPKM